MQRLDCAQMIIPKFGLDCVLNTIEDLTSRPLIETYVVLGFFFSYLFDRPESYESYSSNIFSFKFVQFIDTVPLYRNAIKANLKSLGFVSRIHLEKSPLKLRREAKLER